MKPTELQTPCRVWVGCTTRDGYGKRKIKGRNVRVHRWVVAQIHGWEAIEGKVVMHLCDNPGCFRYDHLRIGTLADNNADRHAKGRSRGPSSRTHCPQNHPYDEENTYFLQGRRQRRACHRIRSRQYRLRRKSGETS